ncbi:selenocysteine-specific translation elongation factor [Desulfosporosinus nitroreducens]|uniref:selenocysteine-specific translation elongation factor n=1 Tax=Desulfosporosinus nitroreducens TaxID=2018668 RepID=UPI00207D6CE7|nr:selenocysteine-specific translation elongation factor [Desulfosporosinus nitroreducens]MCO1602046.1 selenocysteine-specific translation elongation factor [Desulfosporosinus nitroreducens]
MESIVIGTAGHIDHGKTALVKALTGRNTDTLEEERRRGITINLGFAYFTLPCGKVAGIVDVPGHERFVKNMLAGASGIDIAMVVIAANEGVMPQTKEHVDILSYLDIKQSIVVLTKIDMVDEEFKELVLEDTKEYLRDTFLRDAPLVEVDSLSGKGLDALVGHLDGMAVQTDRRSVEKDARMSVDRVFSVNGFGTVVTGTLSDGKLHVGDEVVIYPQGRPAKIRNLQIHEQDVREARAGQRTAINLAGIASTQVSRGCVIAKKDSVFATKVMDVRFSLSRNTDFTVKKMDRLKLYIGARELVVKIIPFGVRQVTAGQEAYGQILFEQEAVVRKGDAFVLRTISPVETIGGGRVVDPTAPRYPKVTQEILDTVRLKDTGSAPDMLETFVRAHPLLTKDMLAGLVYLASIEETLQELLAAGRLIQLQDFLIHPDSVGVFTEEVIGLLLNYHHTYALRRGMSKAELKSRQTFAGGDRKFALLLSLLESRNVVKIADNLVATADFSPQFSPHQQEIRAELESQVRECGYTLPSLPELVGNFREKQQVMEYLLLDTLMALDGQLVIDRQLYQDAREIVKELAVEHGVIKLPDFRDRLQTSRKYALLLLERFDKEKLTKRAGEDRILL